MSTALAKTTIDAQSIEQVLIQGDLSKLNPDQRLNYYNRVCDSVGLNPLTQPFSYLTLQGKTVLYANRACTEQLRQIHGVSVEKLDKELNKDLELYIVTAHGIDKNGRRDTGTGAVNVAGKKADDLANLIMKAETKAKRRMTLSICGLGILDESELDTIPRAKISRQEMEIPDEPAGSEPTKEEMEEAEHKAVRVFEGRITDLKGFEGCSIGTIGTTKIVAVDEKLQADFRTFFNEEVPVEVAALEKRSPKTGAIYFEVRAITKLKRNPESTLLVTEQDTLLPLLKKSVEIAEEAKVTRRTKSSSRNNQERIQGGKWPN